MVPYNRLDTVQQQMSSWSSIRKRKEKSIDFNKYLYIFVFFTNQTREGVSRYQTDILGVVSCGSLFNSKILLQQSTRINFWKHIQLRI